MLIAQPTPIPGALLLALERKEDQRGFFARTWCRKEFEREGLAADMVQASLSHNRLAGTLRGLHFAWPPSREAKLVRCERGHVFDVIIDLRPSSPAFLHHFSVELDDQHHTAIYIPPGVGHGFQTLVNDSDVLYMMSAYYCPELADGYRFNDPAFGIAWPHPVTCIAERDRNYRDFQAAEHALRCNSASVSVIDNREPPLSLHAP